MSFHLSKGANNKTLSDPVYSSLTRLDLGVSALVPRGWTVTGDEARLRVIGPATGGSSPTFTLVQGEPEEPGEAWYEAFCRQAMDQLIAGGSELLRVDTFVLSSFVAVTAVYYRGSTPERAVSQLQAYLWADSTRMLVADAATARAREEADFPVFDHILRSLRLLPPRTV